MTTFTTPRDWTAGEIITESMMDTHVRDNLLHLYERRAGARAYNTGNITCSTATLTTMVFDSERYDTDAFHSTSVNTGRLTVPTGYGGTYMIVGNIRWAANATGQRAAQIRVNGGTIIASLYLQATSADPIDLCVTTLYALSAADYVELMGYQTSGGNLNVTAQSAFSPEFMIQRVA